MKWTEAPFIASLGRPRHREPDGSQTQGQALEVIWRKSSTKWLPPKRQRSRFSVEAEFRIVGETDRFDHCVFTVRQVLDPARTDDGLRPAVESERFFAPASS